MNLLQRLKIWKELKRLEQRARQNPSPSTFVDLGQVYINMGVCDRTLAVADEGLALFPESRELRKLRKFAKKHQLNRRVEEVRTKINKSPTAGSYRELASLYLELGDFGAVQGTCEESIRRFPGEDSAYRILARAKLTNFYRDLSARDGIEAVQNLQRTVELDPKNSKAHQLLVEVFYRVGVLDLCKQHLEILTKLDAEQSYIDMMNKQFASSKTRDAGVGEDFESAFHNAEAKSALINRPVSIERPKASSDDTMGRIRDALAELADRDGVRKATYIKASKALVKGEIRDGKDAFLRVVRVMAKASQRYTRRLDIGNFNKGVIDGDFGHICICSYGDVVAAVQCDKGTVLTEVLVDLQELVAGSLYLSGVKS